MEMDSETLLLEPLWRTITGGLCTSTLETNTKGYATIPARWQDSKFCLYVITSHRIATSLLGAEIYETIRAMSCPCFCWCHSWSFSFAPLWKRQKSGMDKKLCDGRKQLWRLSRAALCLLWTKHRVKEWGTGSMNVYVRIWRWGFPTSYGIFWKQWHGRRCMTKFEYAAFVSTSSVMRIFK